MNESCECECVCKREVWRSAKRREKKSGDGELVKGQTTKNLV